MINLDSLNTMQAVLKVREQQVALTSGNLVNVDTPDFKAKGVDFNKSVRAVMANSNSGIQTSDPRHISGSNSSQGLDVQYVHSDTVRADGNSVNRHLEIAKLSEFEMQYQIGLQLSDAKVSSLKSIIKDAR